MGHCKTTTRSFVSNPLERNAFTKVTLDTETLNSIIKFSLLHPPSFVENKM